MAVNRVIPIIEKLDLVSPGQILYNDRTAHPQNKTGWNEAANSMNGFHAIGNALNMHGMGVNRSRIPIVGFQGTNYTEQATIDVVVRWSLPGGYDRFQFVGETDISASGGGQTIQILIDGTLYLSKIATGTTIFHDITPVNPGQLANPGEMRVLNITLRSIIASPAVRAGSIGFRSGLTSLQITAFKQI